jgi:GTPase SAR1 family protein
MRILFKHGINQSFHTFQKNPCQQKNTKLPFVEVERLERVPLLYNTHKINSWTNTYFSLFFKFFLQDPTIQDNYTKQVKVGDKVCILEILDTAGQDDYHGSFH